MTTIPSFDVIMTNIVSDDISVEPCSSIGRTVLRVHSGVEDKSTSLSNEASAASH